MQPWTGYLRLAVIPKLGKTIANDLYFQGALKLTRPSYPDNTGQAYYYIMNPGGGYVDGDRYRLEVKLEEHAQLLLTTQSSTKIYKTKHVAPVQELDITLKSGSYLEYVPDSLILYQYAQYKQHTIIRMERGATMITTEIVTPGWSPDGRLFSYDKLQLKTEIYMDEALVVYDHLRLNPAAQSMGGLGILEGYTHVGTMIVIGEQATPEFLDQLYEQLLTASHACNMGLSMANVPGFSIRILANSTQEIEKLFAMAHELIREAWFGLKPVLLRKY